MPRPSGGSRPAGSDRTRGGHLLVLGDSIALGNDGLGGSVTEASRFKTLVNARIQSAHGGTWTAVVVSQAGGSSTDVLVTNQKSWEYRSPDAVIIELGINDTDANEATDATNRTTYNTNITNAVNLLTNRYANLSASEIMICGMPPHGNNGRHSGGLKEDSWNSWNTQIETTADSLSCTFVPMYDVYDPGIGEYLPATDPSSYIADKASSATHPNAAGHGAWDTQIAKYMPRITPGRPTGSGNR